MKFILFNKDTVARWQAGENTQVMVSNRKGIGDCQIFCRAADIQIGDNVWEHNIVTDMTEMPHEMPKIKTHLGPLIIKIK